ncbi:type II secretion system F family protein [Pseudomonas syringae]|uniref:type II secretion system F family protein n=1 Tax=Pseudomonas syringae TaxID=317 RepID=UPI000E31FE45|nr:type II secretion system F family protein [Pseudomonas syringae]
MTLFRYQAYDQDGGRTGGELESETIEQATDTLQSLGLLLIEIRPWEPKLFFPNTYKRKKISDAEVARFTDQLAILLEAGQPLESALALQARQSDRPAMASLLNGLLERVKGGSSLSVAMGAEHRTFSNFYLSLVRAGEAAGMLGETLSQLATNLERSRAMRSDLISALIYPAFLVCGVFGSLVLLLTYVVPQFVPIFRDLNVPLPLITECIMALGIFLAQWGIYLILILAGVSCWLYAYLREPSRRIALDARILKVRVVGKMLQGVETARFSLTLGTLVDRKVSLLVGLNITCQVVKNRAIEVALKQAILSTKDGCSLSVALDQTRLFPELAVQMIRVGEQSGKLGTTLLKLADIYDRETQTKLKRFMAALVPTLTLLMTVLVALIMLAVMLPLLSLTSNI